MRKLLVPVLAVAALAPLAGSALAATRSVKVGDNWFVRPSGVPTVTVRKGTRVKWVWTGSSIHNVTVVRGPQRFRSTSRIAGSYAHRVTRRGTYTLICTIHGAADQKMKLEVK